MAFTPSTFYLVAQELGLKSRADGAHLRTLISRAYYGALIEARDARNVNTAVRDGHQEVINAYQGSQADKVVSDALRELRKLRVKADYKPHANLSGGDGQRALALSKRVLLSLNALPVAQPAPKTVH